MLQVGSVIDLPVTVGSIESLAGMVIRAVREGDGGYVCVANVHMITIAAQYAHLRRVMEKADFVTADGLPLVWVLRQQGFRNAERVTGTDLTLRLCERAADEGMKVSFYGGSSETIQALQKSITKRFPALEVASYESPPMLPVHPEVDPDVVNRINESGAHIVFVGLGCPKQEFWMAAYRPHLKAVLIGVGAAFDFIAGTVKRAPVWLQNIGLEWLHRLVSNPGKMWKRYAVSNTLFMWFLVRDYVSGKGMKEIRR